MSIVFKLRTSLLLDVEDRSAFQYTICDDCFVCGDSKIDRNRPLVITPYVMLSRRHQTRYVTRCDERCAMFSDICNRLTTLATATSGQICKVVHSRRSIRCGPRNPRSSALTSPNLRASRRIFIQKAECLRLRRDGKFSLEDV